MKQTDHFNLYTWAYEDFVNLEQMNENFKLLDAALFTRQRAGGHTQGLAAKARGELANLMLSRAHDGADVSFAEDTLLETFSDLSGVESYSQLLCAGGPRVAGSGAALTLTVNYNDGGNSYPRKTIVAASGTTTMGTITANGWFKTESLTIKYTAGGTSVGFAIYQGEKLLGEAEAASITSKSDKTTLTVPLVASIDPNVPCELRAISTGSGIGLYIWEMSLSAAEVLYSGGELTTKAKPLCAGALRLYLRYSGNAPQLAYQVDAGAFTALTPVQTRAGKTHGGSSCSLAIYEIDFGEVTDISFALKLTLTAADTQIYDYCAAVV